MVDQAAKNDAAERHSVVANVQQWGKQAHQWGQQWVSIDKETKDAAYTYAQKATNSLAYAPLAIVALPVVAFAMLAAANVSLFVLFPLAVWWGAFAYWFPEQAQRVRDLVKSAWESLKGYYAKALEFLAWAYTQLGEAYTKAKEYYAKVVDFLLWVYGHPGEAFASAKDYVTSLFGGGNKKPQQNDAEAKSVAAGRVSSYYERLVEFVSSHYAKIVEFVSSYYAKAVEFVSSYYAKAGEFVSTYFAKAVELVTRAYSVVTDFVSNFTTYFFTFVLRVRETVRSLLWDNLRTPSKFNNEQLSPFFPELIESTVEFLAGGGNAIPQAADIKRALQDYLPERMTRNIKDF